MKSRIAGFGRQARGITLFVLCGAALASCKVAKGFQTATVDDFPDHFNQAMVDRQLSGDYRLMRSFCEKTARHQCTYSVRSSVVSVESVASSSAIEIVTVKCPVSCDPFDAFAATVLVLRTLAPGLTDADYAGWTRASKEDIAARRRFETRVGPALLEMYPPGSATTTDDLTFYITAFADR